MIVLECRSVGVWNERILVVFVAVMVHSCQKLSCAEKMYSSGAQGVVLRVSIVLGMVAAVVTILYLTPVPGKSF